MGRTVSFAVVTLLLLAPLVRAQDYSSMTEAQLKAEAQQVVLDARAALENRDEAQKALDGAAEDEKTVKEEQLNSAKEAVEAIVARARAIRAAFDAKGLSIPVKLKELLTETTGEIFLDADIALSLLDRWFNTAKNWFRDNGLQLLLKAFMFVLILVAFRVLARVAGGITRRAVTTSRLRVSDLLRNFFVTVVSKTVFVFGLLIALESIQVDVGPFLAGIGVIGFVIGFALQGTLSNFAAGIMILLYRPYDVGNFVEAAGVKGTVDAMTLVSTTFVTPDNQVHVVPNGSIWGGVITNVTARDRRRVDMTFGVGYGDDLDKVEEVLLRVVKAHPKVMQEPEPVVRVGALADSSVNFIVRPWAKTSDYWAVYWDLLKSVKQAFDAEGINIPFPQRDVHLYRHDEESAA
jgi:small conductance mechanosensitive channel